MVLICFNDFPILFITCLLCTSYFFCPNFSWVFLQVSSGVFLCCKNPRMVFNPMGYLLASKIRINHLITNNQTPFKASSNHVNVKKTIKNPFDTILLKSERNAKQNKVSTKKCKQGKQTTCRPNKFL